MASKLTLEDDQRFALMKLRRNVADVIEPHHDDYFLVRWLRARSWKVEAAEKMLRESLKWRKTWEVDGNLKTWEPPEPISLYYPSGSTGCDKDGSPVIFVPFCGLDIKGIIYSTNKQDLVRLTIKTLEEHLETAISTGAHNVIAIMDLNGFTIKDYAWRPAADLVITLLQMYEANYPEILKTCYIVNAPKVFAIAFAVVKKFLHEYTISKMSIFTNDHKKWQKVLQEKIPLEILPKYYGGNLVDPDGDIKCSSKIRPGGKIPDSYYKYKVGNKSDTADFLTTVIKQGQSFKLPFIVTEEGCALHWEFRTEGHDIRFGITYCDSEGNESPAVRFRRVASNQIDEAGAITCQAPATYTVVFDNSYSLMRNKKLYYKIGVTEPLEKFDIATLPDDTTQSEILNGDKHEVSESTLATA